MRAGADGPGAHRQPVGMDSGIPQGNLIRRLKLLWQVEVAQRFPIHADVPAREAVNRHQRRTRRRYASNQKFSASHADLLAAAFDARALSFGRCAGYYGYRVQLESGLLQFTPVAPTAPSSQLLRDRMKRWKG